MRIYAHAVEAKDRSAAKIVGDLVKRRIGIHRTTYLLNYPQSRAPSWTLIGHAWVGEGVPS